MIKKLAVAATFAASTLISFSAVGATTPQPAERPSKDGPQRSEWDPIYPNCNECAFIPGESPAPGIPAPPGVWVCPTPMHYAICPF